MLGTSYTIMKQLAGICLIGFLGVLFWSCGESEDAQKIIDQVIDNHGGENYEHVKISFDFRDKHYVLTQQGGAFQYERHFEDSKGKVKDILTNEGFKRLLNEVDITDTVRKTAAYTRSVNSVAYFALLPYRLNDPAVNKSYLGSSEIRGQPYHKIEVNFDQKGGGEDHNDRFVYWIHKETLTMEYLAYLYYTDGGGIRFRSPYNVRLVGDIRFSDYENYEPGADSVELWELDKEFESGSLKLLSRIELKNIKVEAL